MTLEPLVVVVVTGVSPRSRPIWAPWTVALPTYHGVGYLPWPDGLRARQVRGRGRRRHGDPEQPRETQHALRPDAGRARRRDADRARLRGGEGGGPHRGRRQGLLRRRRPRRVRRRRPAGRQTLRLRPLPRVLPPDAAARQAVAVRRQRPRPRRRDGPGALLRPGDRQGGGDLRHARDQRRRLPLHDHGDHLPQRPAQEGQRDDAAGRAAERRGGGRPSALPTGSSRRPSSTTRSPIGPASSPPRARS